MPVAEQLNDHLEPIPISYESSKRRTSFGGTEKKTDLITKATHEKNQKSFEFQGSIPKN